MKLSSHILEYLVQIFLWDLRAVVQDDSCNIHVSIFTWNLFGYLKTRLSPLFVRGELLLLMNSE